MSRRVWSKLCFDRAAATGARFQRTRIGNPSSGPMFANSEAEPMCLNKLTNLLVESLFEHCNECGLARAKHRREHLFERDDSRRVWHGWHAFRRGLATNLYGLGVADKTIQAILRHSVLGRR